MVLIPFMFGARWKAPKSTLTELCPFSLESCCSSDGKRNENPAEPECKGASSLLISDNKGILYFPIVNLKPVVFEVKSSMAMLWPIKSEDEDFSNICSRPASMLVRNWRMWSGATACPFEQVRFSNVAPIALPVKVKRSRAHVFVRALASADASRAREIFEMCVVATAFM